MTRPSFARDSVTVLRAQVVEDRYGNESLDWSDPAEHEINECVLQPISGEETLSLDGNAVVSRWSFSGPKGADLTAMDRVTYQGETYEIDGYVRRWESPTGSLAHTEAMLKRVEVS